MKYLVTVLFLICISVITGCDKETDVINSCEPLPIIDGYKTIKAKQGDITLKLPSYADVRRRPSEDRGCEYLTSFSIDYLWHEGRLISEGANRFNVSEGNYIKVRIGYKSSGFVTDDLKKKLYIEPWRIESALAHKAFPLEFYPKYYWDDSVTPSEEALKRAGLDFRWGIRNTKYSNPLTNAPFTAFCSIPPLDKSNPNSRTENEFAEYGDSKCRGTISVSEENKFVTVLVDVWAYLGNDQKGIKEINLIYDAVVEQLESFLQE